MSMGFNTFGPKGATGAQGPIGPMANPHTTCTLYCDFMSADFAGFSPFTNNSIGSNSALWETSSQSQVGHPGIVTYRSGTSAGGNGYWVGTDNSSLILTSNYSFDTCLQFLSVATEEYSIGFHTNSGIGQPEWGAYFYINGSGVVNGNCTNSYATTNASSTYTISLNTWYNFAVLVNSTGTLVTFTISDMSSAILWTDTVSTNLPIGVAMTSRVLGTTSDTTAGKFFLNLDYLLVTMPVVR